MTDRTSVVGSESGTEPESLPAGRTTAEAISAAVRADIVAGRFASGEKLRQVHLARRFGVSTTPVREAFGILQHQGLVRMHPQRGATVFVPTVEDLEEHYEIRDALECLATARAAVNFRPEHSGPLRAALAEMHDCRDPELYVELNHRFHMSIYELSGRRRLVDLIDHLRVVTQAYVQIYAAQVVPSGQAEHEHDEILAACEANDPERAREATSRHLRLTVVNVTHELNRET